jgi:SAM-dependent methyltransferase
MSSEAFDPDWLALREPADHRARAHGLLEPLFSWLGQRGRARVLDLGSGTGSNFRYLAPRLGGKQQWTLVDRDASLLARSMETDGAGDSRVTSVVRVCGELAREGLEAVANADLVTASALLDLVSEAWLEQLVGACRSEGCAALLALTWDGTIEWDVPDRETGADDALVLDAVRAHQRRDKGLGSALGPSAGAAAEGAFRAAGFRTLLRPSPWRLGRDDAELAHALLDGWERAATEQRPDQLARIRGWAERRRSDMGERDFRLAVGHVDLLALPSDRS